MKDIEKNRFLVWLMWMPVIAITGWFSLFVWTVIQVYICFAESKEEKEKKTKPMREQSKYKELNKEENLTKIDKVILKNEPELAKVGKGLYIYDRKKV